MRELWQHNMSFYLKYLITNSEQIRCDSLKKTFLEVIEFDDEGHPYKVPDEVIEPVLDDAVYEDLLSVEICMKDLFKKGLLNEQDIKIIWLVSCGFNINEISSKLSLNYKSVLNSYLSTLGKVAFALGGKFTDEGFCEYISDKFELSDDSEKTLRSVIFDPKN